MNAPSNADLNPAKLLPAVLHDPDDGGWLEFPAPVEVLAAHRLEEVLPVLRAVERRTREEGLHAVLAISYGAAPAFDPSLTALDDGAFPLVWAALSPAPRPCPAPGEAFSETDEPDALAWRSSVERDEYEAAVGAVRKRISAGDTYQVNYTFRRRAPFAGDPWRLFQRLIGAQNPAYGAFLDLGDWAVACASPECFLKHDDGGILSIPMKGTAPRGTTLADDEGRAEALRRSVKNRAENVMIVDMVRNDLGRIAETGSVEVPRLFDVERYPTLWQMTSTVRARTRAGLTKVLQATFPAASITGAPKASTMRIIAKLETTPRRLYTGAIGRLTPDGRLLLNVAIRTALVDRRRGEVEYGVGGGIVWDSTARSEYEECETKSLILRGGASRHFELLETMRWSPGEGVRLLERHLARMRDSARRFDFAFDEAAVRERLEKALRVLPGRAHRLRLLLAADGGLRIEDYLLDDPPADAPPLRLAVSCEPIDPSDPFLYHKTTRRAVYEAALAAHPEADDVLLLNGRGEVCEACLANVAVETGGALWTPPVSCGLLAGTLRAELLAAGRLRERVLTLDDLREAEAIILLNSVRGMRPARLTADATIPAQSDE